MTIREGRLEIAKVGEDQHEIRLGQPEYQQGDSTMVYRLEFSADDFANISMNEWPPTQVNGRYRIDEFVYGFPWDRLKTDGLSMVMLRLRQTSDNRCPYFNAYYVDETVENPTEQELATAVTQVTVVKKNRAFQLASAFGGGGAVITGASTKDFVKSAIATIAGVGIGYGIGSQLEYWAVEE